jgi:hypothetical protein
MDHFNAFVLELKSLNVSVSNFFTDFKEIFVREEDEAIKNFLSPSLFPASFLDLSFYSDHCDDHEKNLNRLGQTAITDILSRSTEEIQRIKKDC